MGKALAVLFTGAGASTVAVGGVALSNGLVKGKSDAATERPKEEKSDTQSNQSRSPQVQTQPQAPARTAPEPAKASPASTTKTTTHQTKILSSTLTFKTLQDFKDNKGGECTKRYFGDMDFSKNDITKIDNTSNKLDSSYFSSESAKGSDDAKSCLVVNWDRTDHSSSGEDEENKWKGNFKWLWAFAKGNKGFVLFTTTKEPITTPAQLDLDGGIYFVEKETAADKWVIRHKKELISGTRNIESDTFDNSFPFKGEAITYYFTSVDNEDNWGFLKDKSDLTKLCSASKDDCQNEAQTTKKFRGSWIWQPSSSSTYTPDKWIKNLKNHLDEMYDTGSLSLEGVFTNLKGSWSNENMSVSTI